jgi:beta-lactamase regulating signal transducer with metallopeptidase domain
MILDIATSPDFFVEMTWKSAAIAGVALFALTLLRSRSAADRAAVIRLAVLLLLALPVVSLAVPALQIEKPVAAIETAKDQAPPPPPAAEAPVAPADTATDVARPAEPAPVTAVPLPPRTKLPTGLMLTMVYVTGVLLLALRLFAGLWTLRRWTAAAEPVRSVDWAASLRRVRARTGTAVPVGLLASADVPSPLSWGLGSPVILIDYETLDRAEDADAVLAHELAHVVRRDWAMLMLSRLAVTLFWFNPLVWLLERALVQQAEEAADLRALSGVEPVSYARTLVACGAHAGGHIVPANSIAGQGLARRVRAVLDEKRRGTPSGSGWTGLAMLLCVAVSAPIAAIELVSPEAPKAPTVPTAPVAPRTATAPLAAMAAPAPIAAVAWADDEDIADAVDQALEASELSEAQLEAIGEAAEAAAEAAADRAEAMAEAEVARVEAEQARVEAEQARIEADQARAEARAATFEATRAAARASVAASARAVARAQVGPLTADDLIAMKIQGVDARYLSELAALAPRIRLSAKEIVATKIHGLTPARLREFADAGYAATDIDDLVAMRIHGVTPLFIREMSAVGYPKLSPDDLVAMRIHGVTADNARRAAAQGRRPTPEELVEMKLRGKI